ncbi:Ig-like domain-containing protein, partial [Paenibacillus sp.]|uniref:Ig-like domain-containing protein n=1 Tax=Paenibacillus sp. TaxID=58172 RepID=UPI0028AE5B89
MKNVRIVKLLSALIMISLLLPNHALVMAMQDSGDEPSAYTVMNNLVMNGDFEESETTDDISSWPNGMKPTYWTVKPWIDSRWGNPNFSIEQESGSDNHYLKVDLKNDVSDKSRATMKSSKIEVESNTNYEFTIDLALESVSGNNFGFKVIEYDQDNKKIIENILITKQGTLGWSEFRGQISTKEQTKSVVIELWIGVTNALNNGGTIMIDNIRMSPLNNIPVSDIQIAEEIHGQVGTNHQLTAIITPSNATNQNVTWTSENENVAVVGPDGLVELVGEGITKIIATTEEGGKTAICNVTSVSSSSSDPIVLNGDFEQSEATDDISTWPHAMKPTYWKVNPWLDPRWGNADFTLEQESGNQYVKVDLNSDVGGKVRTSMASSRFEVDPNAKYKFSIDYQLTSVWGNSFGVKVIEYDQNNNKIASTTLFTKQGNSEWSEFSTLIYTNEKTKFIVNEVWFGVNNALDNGGIIKFDNVRMIPQNAEVEEVELPDSATVYQGLTVKLDVVVKPENVANPNVRWTSSNPDIAAVDDQGVVTGVNIGTTVITAASESNPSAIDTTMVTVKGLELEQMILPAEIMLEEYDNIKLLPKFIPPHTPNREVIWTSNNPEVASVDPNGLVTGFKAGEAIITATSINNREIKANTNIHVYKDDPATWDEFKKLQMKWKMVLLDGIPYTGNDTFIASLAEQKVKDINKEAQDLWDKLVTLSYRQYLWEDQQMVPGKNSDALVNSSKRLRTMALAFSMEGGELYHNTGLLVDIIESLDWIHENWYIISGDKYGNWWNWDIGAPLRFTDINILLADYLSLEQIKTYTNSIDYYEGDFTKISQTGANLSDVLSYELRLGIVEKNPERLASVRDQMSPLFEYVTTGDGFYLDGSFIQHGTIAYTGSYGEVTIQGTSNLLNMLNESRWEVTDPNVQNVYNWVFDAFAPVIYKGEMMDMVRGRAISRYNQSGHAAAAGVMSSIIRLAE